MSKVDKQALKQSKKAKGKALNGNKIVYKDASRNPKVRK